MRSVLTNPTDSEYWQTIFDIIPFPIYVVDIATHRVIAANRAMRRRITLTGSGLCYQDIYQQDKPCIFCRIGELVAMTGLPNNEVVFDHFNESDDRWYQLQESLLVWVDGRKAKYSIAVDISTLKQAQNELAEAHALLALRNRELEQVSITDRLTGLFNRRKLDEELLLEMDRIRRTHQPLSVILADIDQFKMINDQYGHPVGDIVLASIAQIFERAVRKTDIVGRWGGEEFMILCPNTDLGGAAVLADHVRQEIAASVFAVVGQKTCSFGVAQLADSESMGALVARTDAAMYRAKTSGRNRVEVDGVNRCGPCPGSGA